MDHSTTMYLMGPDGQYRTHLRAGMTAEEMAAAIKPHL
jgi:cytochrome oxidase Cu insertion factor (SCO1/SenC/PrrC family)